MAKKLDDVGNLSKLMEAVPTDLKDVKFGGKINTFDVLGKKNEMSYYCLRIEGGARHVMDGRANTKAEEGWRICNDPSVRFRYATGRDGHELSVNGETYVLLHRPKFISDAQRKENRKNGIDSVRRDFDQKMDKKGKIKTFGEFDMEERNEYYAKEEDDN